MDYTNIIKFFGGEVLSPRNRRLLEALLKTISVPSDPDPDVNLDYLGDGTIAFDTTDNEFRQRVNGSWSILSSSSGSLGGQTLDNTVTSPSASEDGFYLAWNDTNNEYELKDIDADTSKIGEIVYYVGTTPNGVIVADGSEVSRTGLYADLFSVVGTTYGVGDGSTTFNLPDFRGRTLVGSGTGSGLTQRFIADEGGNEQTNSLPVYNTTASTISTPDTDKVLGPTDIAGAKGATVYSYSDQTPNTTINGSSSEGNMQPYHVTHIGIRFAVSGSTVTTTSLSANSIVGTDSNGDLATIVVGSGLNFSAGNLEVDFTTNWTGTFDGQEGTYYLNWNNFTNTPTTISGYGITDVSGGAWTPTITGVANVASSNVEIARYSRSGDHVSGVLRVGITPTSIITTTTFRVSLPVASNFTSTSDATYGVSIEDFADTTNNEFTFTYTSGGTTAEQILPLTFEYIVA
jgi:microcystin-dependent protein